MGLERGGFILLFVEVLEFLGISTVDEDAEVMT